MAEEQRCQEGHRPCANNCGFFGSPATLNLCSKCYGNHQLKEEQRQATAAVDKSISAPPSPAAAVAEPATNVTVPQVLALPAAADVEEASKDQAASIAGVNGPSRCAACRRRVRLTGFRCRCGSTFCGGHRYAEQHDCTFDFKAAGREAIALANPVVKADKLRRI